MLPAIRNNGLVPTDRPVNRIASLFDRFFGDDFFGPATAWSSLPLATWEDEHNLHIEMDAPGLTDKDIEVSVHDGALYVSGERRCERTEGGYDTRTYGRFEQRLALPTLVDADKVEAKLANGVLKVTLPKSEQAKPRKISIKTE